MSTTTCPDNFESSQLQQTVETTSNNQQVQTTTETTQQPEITIVDYDDEKHLAAFKELSIAWISEHWVMEQRDIDELDHVQENIISAGGFILIAECEGKAVGTCAMIPPLDKEKYDYELAKFTTSADVRGRGLGKRLALAALERAKKEKKLRIYLETNQLCVSAIRLYLQLGFIRIPGHSPVFERGDTLMELTMQ